MRRGDTSSPRPRPPPCTLFAMTDLPLRNLIVSRALADRRSPYNFAAEAPDGGLPTPPLLVM